MRCDVWWREQIRGSSHRHSAVLVPVLVLVVVLVQVLVPVLVLALILVLVLVLVRVLVPVIVESRTACGGGSRYGEARRCCPAALPAPPGR